MQNSAQNFQWVACNTLPGNPNFTFTMKRSLQKPEKKKKNKKIKLTWEKEFAIPVTQRAWPVLLPSLSHRCLWPQNVNVLMPT